MAEPLPIIFANLPIGLNPLNVLDEQFAAATDGAYMQDGTLPATALASVTGTGAVVLANSPTIVTPNLGTPSAVNLTNATGLASVGSGAGVLPTANGGLPTAATPNALPSAVDYTKNTSAMAQSIGEIYTAFNDTTGIYTGDAANDPNGGFAVAIPSHSPWLWINRPDWYVDGENLKLGATSDDTDAVQGALNIIAHHSKPLFWPPGVVTTQKVTLPPGGNIEVIGVSQQNSVWKAHAALGTGIPMFINTYITGSGGARADANVIFRNMTFDGNGLGTDSRTTALFTLADVDGVELDRIKMTNFARHFVGAFAGSINMNIHDSFMSGTGGFFFAPDSVNSLRSNNLHMFRNRFDTIYGSCALLDTDYFHCHDNRYTNIDGTVYFASSLAGTIIGSPGGWIHDDYIQNLTGGGAISGCAMELGTNNLIIEGCQIYDVGDQGIVVEGSRVIVRKNIIARCGKNGPDSQGGAALQINSLVYATSGKTAAQAVQIKDNIVYDDQGTPTTTYAVLCQYSGGSSGLFEYITIKGNDFSQLVPVTAMLGLNVGGGMDYTTLVCEDNRGTSDVRGGLMNLQLGYETGQHYKGKGIQYSTTPVVQTDATLYMYPFEITEDVTLAGLMAGIATSVASSNAKLALYRNDVGTGRPTQLLVASSTAVDGSATALTMTDVPFASNTLVKRGIYWFATLTNGATKLQTVSATKSDQNFQVWSGGLGAYYAMVGTIGIKTAQAYASGFPADVTSGFAWGGHR